MTSGLAGGLAGEGVTMVLARCRVVGADSGIKVNTSVTAFPLAATSTWAYLPLVIVFTLIDRDLAFENAGKMWAPIIAIRRAAIPIGTSHDFSRWRSRANSFGATVLKCWSSFWRRCSFSLRDTCPLAVCSAALGAVWRTRSIVSLRRS